MWQGAEDFTVSYKKYGAVFVNTFIHLRDYYGGAYQEDFNRAIGHVFWLRFLIAQKDKDVDSYVKFITRFFSEYLEIMEGLYGKTESSYLKKKIRRLRRWRKVLLIGLGLIFIVLIAILFRFIKC